MELNSNTPRRLAPLPKPAAPPVARTACAYCPDGYVWTPAGPTDAECPYCAGRGYVVVELQS